MLPTCLITALPAEARPFISYFGMRAIHHNHLRLFQGDYGYLLQCGVGKLNAAASTAAMLQSLPDVAAVINVGIAGSGQPLGTTCVAHGVVDQSSEQQWFPHLPSVKQLPDTSSVQVVTVDRPASDYSQDTAFDMEASGIFNAASKVLDLAFVHSIKVISDNEQNSIDLINAKSASESIENTVPTVEKLMQALPFDTLPSTAGVNSLSTTLTKRLHYTTTEQHTLNRLLHRYQALVGGLPDEHQLLALDSAKSVRQKLQSDINNARVIY